MKRLVLLLCMMSVLSAAKRKVLCNEVEERMSSILNAIDDVNRTCDLSQLRSLVDAHGDRLRLLACEPPRSLDVVGQ